MDTTDHTNLKLCWNCEGCGITILPVSGTMEVCDHCYGSGYARIECPRCKGKGNLGVPWMSWDDEPTECDKCFGSCSIRVEGHNPPKRIHVALVEHDLNITIKKNEQ